MHGRVDRLESVVPQQVAVARCVKAVVALQETFSIGGVVEGLKVNFAGAAKELPVTALKPDGTAIAFKAVCRIDTPQEVLYYLHGGILPYVLRQLLTAK